MSNLEAFTAKPSDKDTGETDAQIEAKLQERFDILEALTEGAIQGVAQACIFSGPAGLGKSFTVEKALQNWDPNKINHEIIKGYVRATGLYKLLYKYRQNGQVIVFDDADSIFFDDVSLNLLKAVCDTTETRRVSWLSEAGLVDEETGVPIPRDFEFEGTILFITNLDFDKLIDRGHKLAPHLSALVSRSHYIDLAMKTRRDYIIRIRQVVKQGLLEDRGLSKSEQKEVIDFVETHADSLRELSLRIVIKVAGIRKMKVADWRSMARVTCCRNK